jgi:hypothetical protein
MATYHEIMLYVEAKYGFVPHAYWITEVKQLCNLPLVRGAPNKVGSQRDLNNCCPKAKIEPIKEALEHFGMI